jgi:uncharacterized protein YjbI with pentapeptide repeats
MTLRNCRRVRQDRGSVSPPMSAWSWMLAGLAAVVITALIVTTWLLAIANHANAGTDRANSRLDAVRTGLAAGAGAGAAVGLMLAFRRQHHQEIATELSARDATERRITELYTKAVEQLGNEKAPVRLGGLYALERLAQDNPAHRQTIVDVICAYLRMPFDPEDPDPMDERTSLESEPWRQEKQVRLTAQRILAAHLRPDRGDRYSTDPRASRFWPDTRLDLVGATLVDFRLQNCVVADAIFRGAIFSGPAVFGEATFTSGAVFGNAVFSSTVWFVGATFTSGAAFGGATFSDDAMFSSVTLSGNVAFNGAAFGGSVNFDRATFGAPVNFEGVTFGGPASFNGATFRSTVGFERAIFSGDVWFEGSTSFSDDVTFDKATFNGVAGFEAATFSSRAAFDAVTFNSTAEFSGATFGSTSSFGAAVFRSEANFSRALFRSDAWFQGATFSGTGSFAEATFDSFAWFDQARFSDSGNSVSFYLSVVTQPDFGHVWPIGWGLGSDGNGGYTVLHVGPEVT